MDNCYFCTVAATNPKEVFYDHEYFVALWDGNPLAPGHALIIPKRHVQYVGALSDIEARELMPFAQEVSSIVKKADLERVYMDLLDGVTDIMSQDYLENSLKKVKDYNRPPDAFNFGINDGPEAGQSVYHMHLHLIPRWSGDVENPRGGIRNMFSSDKYSREP